MIEPTTLLDMGVVQLRALCGALGLDRDLSQGAVKLFTALTGSWGARSAQGPPLWASDITDDHSPFEFSIAFDDDRAELRFLLEVQGEKPSHDSNWAAGLAMNRWLAQEHDIDLLRLAAIEGLFAPTAACPRFSIWHAVSLHAEGSPAFKVYLNPQARGRATARATVEEGLRRLGFASSIAHLPPAGAQVEERYFSLDLTARPEARVKVYTAHTDATSADVDLALTKARWWRPGAAAAFCEALADSPWFASNPVLTCLSFVEGQAMPTEGTVHFPVRAYAPNDEVIRQRLVGAIHPAGAAHYQRALAAFARRPLARGIGMQTYASLRLDEGHAHATVYLAPEVYQVGAPR
jgi:DMATS type aromatic prenyltransferase